MTYPLPMTREEAYLAYKAGVIEEGDLKPSLNNPRNQLEAWLAYWTGLADTYPVKNVGKNLLPVKISLGDQGVDASYDDDTGYITLSGTPTTEWPQLSRPYPIFGIIPAGTTVTFSVTQFPEGVSSIHVRFYGKTGSEFKDHYILSNKTSVTFTTTSDTYRVMLVLRCTAETPISGTFGLQIEKGSSSTTFEKYSGEPEMLTDEEACIAYLSGVTDSYPTALKDPRDPRLVGYLKYLISARFGRPYKPFNRPELYLSLMKPPVITNNTPSSDITLTGTCEAPFIDIKAYGDTSQIAYTGKNLLNNAAVTTTESGVTFTVNSDKSIVVNGKATANVFFLVNYINLDTTKQYTLSGGHAGGDYFNKYALYADIGPNLRAIDTGDSDVFTPSQTNCACYICVRSGITMDNAVFRPQIEVGSTPTSYEPYVGGAPSPSPDYPQAVNTVTGRQVIGVSGKNMYNRNTDTIGEYLTVTGGTTTNTEWRISDYIVVSAGEKYTISGIPATANLPKNCFYTAEKEFVSAFDYGSQVITIPEGVAYLRLSIYSHVQSGGRLDHDDETLMLEEGETASEYEPYTGGDYEINLGKNLFDKSSVVYGAIDKTTGEIVPRDGVRSSDFIKVNAGTQYIVSGRGSDWTNQGCYRADKSFIGRYEGNLFTTPADCAYVRLAMLSSVVDVLQLEVGSTATTYAPYFEPIELCKIGDYQDYIYRDADGDWYMHKVVAKYKIEDLVWGENPADGFIRFVCAGLRQTIVHPSSSSVLGVGKCNKYAISTAGNTYGSYDNTFGLASNGNLYVSDSVYHSDGELDSWKTARAGTEFYLALVDPIDTEITNTALIEQLDALVEGGSYQDTTYIEISATDPNLPALLKVEAGAYR